jgi:hypothetical protein
MTVPPLALLAASALLGAGTTITGTQASITLGSRYDAAYAVFAVGDQPLAAGPSAFSTSIRIRADTGAAQSADGGLAVGAGKVTAGNGQATAVVHDVIALEGLVRAASITARCRNGVVTSRLFGGTVGHLQGRASVAFDVRSKNRDGSTTVIGLQIRVHAGRGTVINIASATCAPAANSNSRIRPAPVDRSTSFGADAGYSASLLPTHPRTVHTDNAPVGR